MTLSAGEGKAGFGEGSGNRQSVSGYMLLPEFAASLENNGPQQDNCKQPHEGHQA